MNSVCTNRVDLLNQYDIEKKCLEKIQMIRWNGNPVCPMCGTEKPYVINKGLGFKCRSKSCLKKFTVKTGLVFERSKIPLQIWFAVLHACTISRTQVSSCRLARDLGITQKTAWSMLNRIRTTLRQKQSTLLVNHY